MRGFDRQGVSESPEARSEIMMPFGQQVYSGPRAHSLRGPDLALKGGVLLGRLETRSGGSESEEAAARTQLAQRHETRRRGRETFSSQVEDSRNAAMTRDS